MAQCVEALVESGAQVDAETADYSTALQLAAAGGHTGCCKALLEAGAIVDAQGGPQRSAALHLAAAGGHTPTVRLLLGEGADTDLRDRQVCAPAPAREGGWSHESDLDVDLNLDLDWISISMALVSISMSFSIQPPRCRECCSSVLSPPANCANGGATLRKLPRV